MQLLGSEPYDRDESLSPERSAVPSLLLEQFFT
jgi:hypothetical protein